MSPPPQTSLESQLAELAGRARPSPDGWDQIQARARRHDRRRRVVMAATLSVAALLGSVTVWARLRPAHHSSGVAVTNPPVLPRPASPPPSPAAWVSGGQLWLLNGPGPPRPVPGSSPAADPEWSFDGRWVSYLRDQGSSHTELWVVHPDGTGNRKLWTGKPGGVEWSPTADELAVSNAPAVGVGGLSIVATDGSVQQVVTDAAEVNSFAWSPGGQSIAYSEVLAPARSYQSPLDIRTVHGPGVGDTTTVLRAAAGDGIAVGPWWPDGDGLLYWIEPQYNRAAESDGLPLMSAAISGAAPVTLTTAVVALAWLAWVPDGRLLVVGGAGQLPSENKALELCSPASGSCQAVPTPANTVALDPALSPDGQQVAFVVADQSAQANAAWYATRRLWVADLNDLAAAHPVAGAGAGAAVPSWSADGETIGYTTATNVETIGAAGGKPVVVSGTTPLSGNDGLDGEAAFGKLPWSGHAVWAGTAR